MAGRRRPLMKPLARNVLPRGCLGSYRSSHLRATVEIPYAVAVDLSILLAHQISDADRRKTELNRKAIVKNRVAAKKRHNDAAHVRRGECRPFEVAEGPR